MEFEHCNNYGVCTEEWTASDSPTWQLQNVAYTVTKLSRSAKQTNCLLDIGVSSPAQPQGNLRAVQTKTQQKVGSITHTLARAHTHTHTHTRTHACTYTHTLTHARERTHTHTRTPTTPTRAHTHINIKCTINLFSTYCWVNDAVIMNCKRSWIGGKSSVLHVLRCVSITCHRAL